MRSASECVIGRLRERGVQIVGCTMLARFHMLAMYEMSLALSVVWSESVYSDRSSTRQSLWVAVGGSLRRMLKKVSWNRTCKHDCVSALKSLLRAAIESERSLVSQVLSGKDGQIATVAIRVLARMTIYIYESGR